MTLDDAVAAMRARFTPTEAGSVVREARITAEEWAAIAGLVYIRDVLEEVAARPDDATVLERARAEAARARSADPARTP
jgi:hypothetical protein